MNRITRLSRYEVVRERISGLKGPLLDVGARDRVLLRYLPPNIEYFSADKIGGHDYRIDLEFPLDFPDRAFPIVVALDVLEHVDRIHLAFQELMRITGDSLFLSFPNMTVLSKRIGFLLSGQLGRKYDLLPLPLEDRHRWVTSYYQTINFVTHIAMVQQWDVIFWNLLQSYGRFNTLLAKFPYLPILLSLRVHTLLFELKRQ